MRKYWAATLLLGFIIAYCSISSVSKLDPESQLFLSQVQYIITPKEKKEFLSLKTPQERKKFIEEFWKLRDPDPSTEANEFKEAYMARVIAADKLFREGSKRGWETDRGMVFILLGPPSDRYVQPVADNAQYQGYEIWVYEQRGFRVVFVDRRGTGHYEILYNEVGAAFYDALNQARKAFMKMGSATLFRFTVKPIIKNNKLVLKITLPMEKILLEKKNGKFYAELMVKVSGTVNHTKINLSRNYKLLVKKLNPINLELEIPFYEGKYYLKITLIDKIGEAKSVKDVKFNIKRRKL